jgi:AcrR family transcriptional regulator
MPSKRQVQKEETRKKIMRCAYQIFSEEGFGSTTQAIAKRAGVSHGTVFAHFPAVGDLLSALLTEFGDSIGARLHRLAENKEGMEELLAEHLAVLAEYEDFYTRLLSERSLLPGGARSTLLSIQSTVAFHFYEVVTREIREKKVKQLPPHMLFNIWIGLIHYYLLNKDVFSPEEPVLNRYRTELLGCYLALIQNEEESK